MNQTRKNRQPSNIWQAFKASFLRYSFTSVMVLFTSSLWASEQEEPEERWFEVEVILYKTASDDGLFRESWDDDVKLQMPENIIDFLQPFGPAEIADESSKDDELAADQELQSEQPKTNLKQGDSVSQDVGEKPNEDNLSSESAQVELNAELELEKPFVLLDETLLRLSSESRNLAQHPSYQLLAHFAWRQPIAAKSTSTPIRIAGGADFHEAFEYSGAKLIELDSLEDFEDPETEQELLQDENNPLLTDETEQPSLEQLNRVDTEASIPTAESADEEVKEQDSQLDAQTSEQQALVTDEIEGSSLEEPEMIALPWIPEIDGSIEVYIKRNYLHIDTDLYFRRPDKEEVDMFNLGGALELIETDQQLLEPTPEEIESPQNFNDFTWEYDGDFLEQDSQKIYTERLFNYPLKQTRRLRSTELHYFDHPLIGMLVVITPYELNSTEPELEQE